MSGSAPSIEAALAVMFERLSATPAETVPLGAAFRRTLAAGVVANSHLPPWDNSAMDGYACRAADIEAASQSNPVRLRVAATIAAGAETPQPLRPGEAMRIMTGAPVPQGADSVVRVEDTDGGAEAVLIRDARDVHGNIRPRGQDLRPGDTAVAAGSRLGAAELAMLAAVGKAEVAVHRVPRIAILCSGDELVPVTEAADRDTTHIVSANSYSLAAIIRDAGGEPVDLGIVRDDMTATKEALQRARGCDLLVTSGGISVGGFDYMRAAIAGCGGEVLFWRVPMRPGYNSAFGMLEELPWLGVPGNPVSALVAGEVMLRPAIGRLRGSATPYRTRIRVVADETIPSAKAVTLFLRGVVERSATGLPHARLAGAQGSAILSSSVRANALLIVTPGTPMAPGAELDALVLRDEVAD